MDSVTNVSIIITISSLLCLLTIVSPTTAEPLSRPNLKLIQKACNRSFDPKFCLDYLSKTPQIVSATRKSPLAVAGAIVETGLNNAQRMRGYASKKSVKNPAVKSAYGECAKLIGSTTLQLELVLNILRRPGALAEEGASEDASYSLMVSTDGLRGCYEKLASLRVEDRYMRASAKRVKICSMVADNILTNLTP